MKNIDSLLPFYDQYAIVCMKGYKFGLIDKNGLFAIPALYDLLHYFGGPFVKVNIGWQHTADYPDQGKWGIVNLQNEVVLPVKYDEIDIWDNGTSFTICCDDRWGAIDNKGRVIIPATFDYLGTPTKEGLLLAKIADKYGWINMQGDQVIEMLYDETSYCLGGPCKPGEPWVGVRQAEEWFYIDTTGKRVLL